MYYVLMYAQRKTRKKKLLSSFFISIYILIDGYLIILKKNM